MKKRRLGFIILAFATLVWSVLVQADVKIEFPDEELSTESVLPVFEEKGAIKNRRVKHKGRVEINLMGGMVASEPIYSPFNFGASLTYHFNNTSAIHLMGVKFMEGLTASGESLKNGNVFQTNGQSGAIKFDPLEAPHKELFVALNYQYTAYYGKISLSQETVMNLTLSGLLGAGAYMMGDLIIPAANLGLSQRFYFNSYLALRFDILFSAFSGPDITSAGSLDPGDGIVPDPDRFENEIQFDSNIFLGLSFLL